MEHFAAASFDCYTNFHATSYSSVLTGIDDVYRWCLNIIQRHTKATHESPQVHQQDPFKSRVYHGSRLQQ